MRLKKRVRYVLAMIIIMALIATAGVGSVVAQTNELKKVTTGGTQFDATVSTIEMQENSVNSKIDSFGHVKEYEWWMRSVKSVELSSNYRTEPPRKVIQAISSTVGVTNNQYDNEILEQKWNKSAEKLDSELVRLMNATNKEQFAERSNIEYRNGTVQVVVELEYGVNMPRGYNFTRQRHYTGQGKNLAQAYIPVDALRSLSNESVVERVRLPQRGAPSQEADDGGQTSDGETDDIERTETGESGSSENATQETQDQTESDTEDAEGLSSVAGSLLATLVIILTAAYGRRKL